MTSVPTNFQHVHAQSVLNAVSFPRKIFARTLQRLSISRKRKKVEKCANVPQECWRWRVRIQFRKVSEKPHRQQMLSDKFRHLYWIHRLWMHAMYKSVMVEAFEMPFFEFVRFDARTVCMWRYLVRRSLYVLMYSN